MITIFETKYYGPTDNNGSRIKVTNKRTNKSRWHHWDYAVNAGLDQHEHAVWQSAAVAVSVTLGGITDKGYLFALETGEE
jgi:hypothetical protein